MKQLLEKGLRKAKRMKAPSEGTFCPLFNLDTKNGWHYQIEYVHDSRYEDKKFVSVFAFKPPRNFCARSADLYLSQKV